MEMEGRNFKGQPYNWFHWYFIIRLPDVTGHEVESNIVNIVLLILPQVTVKDSTDAVQYY
jgi:hypothetical protein